MIYVHVDTLKDTETDSTLVYECATRRVEGIHWVSDEGWDDKHIGTFHDRIGNKTEYHTQGNNRRSVNW